MTGDSPNEAARQEQLRAAADADERATRQHLWWWLLGCGLGAAVIVALVVILLDGLD